MLGRVLGLWMLVALQPGVALGQERWHDDTEAQVRVKIPWSNAEIKTGAQVAALIGHENGVEAPPGASFTSAIYAPKGVPFAVIWRRQDPVPPTRRELTDLAEEGRGLGFQRIEFDPGRMRGVGWPATVPEPLQARVLFQIGKGATVFLAYYYESPQDAAYFYEFVESLALHPGVRLGFDELESGGLRRGQIAWAIVAALAALVLCASFVHLLLRPVRPLARADVAVDLAANMVARSASASASASSPVQARVVHGHHKGPAWTGDNSLPGLQALAADQQHGSGEAGVKSTAPMPEIVIATSQPEAPLPPTGS